MQGVEQQNNLVFGSEFSYLNNSAGGGGNKAGNIIRRALESRSKSTNQLKILYRVGGNECTKVALVCSLYQTALDTLTQLRLDILTGKFFSYNIKTLGPHFRTTNLQSHLLYTG